MSPGLPHHRRGPRVDERRYDPEERAIVKTGIALAYVLGVMVLVYLAAMIAGTA